ncbi:hypothetical protein F5888DRAFT_1889776 [Russula emetica]|nr:hypothetical protein F5888DRAFT_1889776 [Russula emetica]
MENTPLAQSYALSLLTLMGNQEGTNEDNPPLGWALHLETQSSVFNLAAHRLLRTLIEHSPSPEAVAQQFMTELARCENSAVIDLGDALSTLCDTFYVEYYVQVDSLNSDRSISPANWAAAVYKELSRNGNISPLTNLAVLYLNDLVIPFRNPTGRRTPTSSQSLTPDPMRRDNSLLLESATVCRNQAALKELVLRRDGPSCPVTGASFDGDGSVIPRCTPIIPFSIHEKEPVLVAIEMFTGKEVSADTIQRFNNHPANAINLESNAHDSMDKRLAWGIEAKSVNNGWKYYFRPVKPAGVPIFIRHIIQDGDEIKLGKGDDWSTIELPDPRLCNLRLAVARVFAASGFAEVVKKILKDNEGDAPTDFGDELSRRLAMLSVLGY